MDARSFTNAMEIGVKGGMFGAAMAYRRGVNRQRVREAVMQVRVNAYAGAVLRNRAARASVAKDSARDAGVASFVGLFDGHR